MAAGFHKLFEPKGLAVDHTYFIRLKESLAITDGAWMISNQPASACAEELRGKRDRAHRLESPASQPKPVGGDSL